MNMTMENTKDKVVLESTVIVEQSEDVEDFQPEDVEDFQFEDDDEFQPEDDDEVVDTMTKLFIKHLC